MNPLLLNAFNDELGKISLQKEASFGAALGRAASHLGGGVGRAMASVGKDAPKKGFRRTVANLGEAALKDKRTAGKITAGVAGAGLLGTGVALS